MAALRPVPDSPAGLDSKGYATFLPSSSCFARQVLACCYSSALRDLWGQARLLFSFVCSAACRESRRSQCSAVFSTGMSEQSQQAQKTSLSNSQNTTMGQIPKAASFLWLHTTTASLTDHKAHELQSHSQMWKRKGVFYNQVDSSNLITRSYLRYTWLSASRKPSEISPPPDI